MIRIDTDGLAQAIAAQQEGYTVALLNEANETIAVLQEQIVAKDEVIRQYAQMAREQAITIARLRLRCENEEALARAVATRDARARGLAEVAQYSEDCRRTADLQR